MKQELKVLLTRAKLVQIKESREDRQALIASLRALKDRYTEEDIPLPFKQRGLTAFIREIDEYTKKPSYTDKDDENLTKSIDKYLRFEPRKRQSGEGAGVEMEESKEEEKAEEKEEEKAEPPESPKKRSVAESMRSPTIRRKPDAPPSSLPPPRPTMSPAVSSPRPPAVQSPRPPIGISPRMRALQAQVAPAPAPPPPPAPAQAQATPPPTPTAPQAEPQPEEKSIEDISTEQVVEIPSERKGTDGKSIKQLDGDIKFFLSKYPSLLKQEAAFYKKMKKTKRNLVELHRRIEAKLAPVEKKPQTIGVIVDADKYIDERIKALLVEKTMEGLKPADLVVDVSEPEDKSIQRKGSYVVSKGRAGKLAVERAPVFRNIPTTNPQPKPRPYKDVSMLKSQRWDLTNTAKKHILDDPFIEKQPTKRINLLL